MVEEFARFFLGPPARRSLGRMATFRAGRAGTNPDTLYRHQPASHPASAISVLVRQGRRRWAALAGGAVVVAATGALASPGLPTSTTYPGAAETMMATKLQHGRVLPYPADQVWPTTIRYLRVDRGFAVVDRDRDAGFILFEFTLGRDGEAKGRGSIELIATADPSGRDAVKLQVSTDAGPVHLPHAIAEGLAAKLKAEHGQPAPPPPSAPPSPTPPPSKPPEAPDDGLWVPEEPS
jgi:hypothetical protein